MKKLVLGATGATGKLLVEQLLNFKQEVIIIVRPGSNFPELWKNNQKITIVKANIFELLPNDLSEIIKDCDSVFSCLGHNLTLKGLFGQPRKLVTDAIKLVDKSINLIEPENPIKLILMNTAGNSNRNINETISFGEKIVISLIRFAVPPHSDNEQASDYIRLTIDKNPKIQWSVVRPDTLINIDEVTDYEVHPSPITSAIFKPGKTSRINVANFMALLDRDDKLWEKWKSQMPVIYNKI